MDIFHTLDGVVSSAASEILLRVTRGAFIDIGCGRNFLSYLLARAGMRCYTYDLHPPRYLHARIVFVRGDWLAVKEVASGVVAAGFNPPFGYQGHMARRFIEHLLRLCAPRWLFFILPHIHGGWLPPNYAVERKVRLPDKSFHTPAGDLFAYPTAFYILRRDATLRAPPSARPAGFRCSKVVAWREDPAVIYIRNAGRNAGTTALWFYPAGAWVQWRWRDGAMECLAVEPRRLSANNFTQLELPHRWASAERLILFDYIAQECYGRCRERGMRGANFSDIYSGVRKAISNRVF